MRKNIIPVITIVCILMATIACWANDEQSQNDQSMLNTASYVSAANIYVDFNITKGTAACKTKVVLKAGKKVSSAHITAIIKTSSGAVVKKFSENVKPSGMVISWKDSYKLSNQGKYYLHVIVKTYNSDNLIETITQNSNSDTY